MSYSNIRGGLKGRLASHFALCATAAVGLAASTASADVVYYTPNWTIPANIDGLYINVETQQTGTAAAAVPGWDINPYGSTTIIFFNATGTGMLRYPGITTGSAGNLPINTPVDASGSYGSGTVTFGTAAGNWVLNTSNYFAFRFTGSSNQTHYGWGRMDVGSSQAVRSIAEIAFESTPGVPILVGSTGGGGPPPYDPCAPFNPTLQIGSNNVNWNDTAGNLTLSGCGGTAFKANYYKFTPALSATYTFNTCASGAATRMAILSGCAAGSSQLACNDNSCGSSSSVALAMSSGTTYYIVVGAETSSATLPSPLAVTVEAPADPRCASAFPVQFGSNNVDTLINDGNVVVRASATGTSIIYGAVWYRFVPSVSGAYTFSLCGSVGDTKMALAAACPSIGQNFDSIAYNDDSCACSAGCGTTTQSNYSSRLNFTNTGLPLNQDLQAGQTYYLLVGGFGTTTGPVSAILEIDGPPPSNCPADLDGDGIVGGLDLSALLASWGQGSNGDVDGDGDTDGGDLTALLAAWGTSGC